MGNSSKTEGPSSLERCKEAELQLATAAATTIRLVETAAVG